MPVSLSEYNDLLFSKTSIGYNSNATEPPRYNHYPIYHNQSPLPQGYNMPNYNSNYIIPSYNEANPMGPPGQSYMNEISAEYPNAGMIGVSPISVVVDSQQQVPTQIENSRHYRNSTLIEMDIPRQHSAVDASRKLSRNMQQYAQFSTIPEQVGSVPMMKDVIENDHDLNVNTREKIPKYKEIKEEPKVEKFRYLREGQECVDMLNHIKRCEGCRMLLNRQGNDKIYIAIILMLVIIFIVVVYFLLRNKNSGYSIRRMSYYDDYD